MTKRSLEAVFCGEAEERFRFLEAAGFDAPTLTVERDHASLCYESERFTVSVDVSLVGREDGVTVHVQPRGWRFLSGSLDCLYQEAGLGPVNWITHTATSQHSLEKAIDANAQALEQLLPTLFGPRFDELMMACRGR